MDFSTISNHELVKHTKQLVSRERETVVEVILCLGETKRRRLHALMGHGSLQDYCVNELGLTPDQAWKRLQVAGVCWRFPWMLPMLRSGETHLSHLAMTAPKVTNANEAVIREGLKGRSKREFEAFLNRVTPDGEVLPDRELELVKVEIRCEEQTAKKFDKVRRMLGCKGKETAPGQVLDRLLEEYLERHDPERMARRAAAKAEAKAKAKAQMRDGQPRSEKPTTQAEEARVEVSPTTRSRYIPAATRHAVVIRTGGRCNFVGLNGKRCEQTVDLEIDHLKPWCRGGTHALDNLDCVCREHNVLRAELVLGRETMAPWTKTELEDRQLS